MDRSPNDANTDSRGQGPDPLDAVPVKNRVSTYHRHVLDLRLRHQEPVERIAMMPWQPRLNVDAFHRDW
jgi:hypothetical protein